MFSASPIRARESTNLTTAHPAASARVIAAVAILALLASLVGLVRPSAVALGLSHVGTGALATSTGTSATVALPSGRQSGDLLVLACQGRNNNMDWSATGYSNLLGPVGPAGTRMELQYKWAAAVEPNSIPVANASGLNGWSCSITALRGGVGSGSPLDAPVASQTGTGSTMTAPSATTVTSGALVTRWFASADDNAHGNPSGGTALAFGGATYHTVTGVDHASSMAHLTDSSPGTTGTATMSQTANAADPWVAATVALKPGGGPPPGGPGQATVGITPGAGIGASTFDADSFQIDNTGGNNITQIVINLSKAFYPDLRFDPTGQAGDDLAMCVTPGTSDSVGYVVPANPCTTPYSGGTAANGFTTLTLNFTNFGPGEGFSFSADVDPTSIKGFTSAGNAGAVSGLELAGSTATVTFTDGTQSTQTFGDGSQGGSLATVPSTVTAAVGLSVLGVTATDGGYSNSADTATVTGTAQTAVITGPAGSTVKLIVSDAVIEDAPPGGFNDLDPIERNKAVSVTTLTAVIGAGGSVNVPFAVSDTAGEATYIMAAATGAAGLNGPVTAPIYLELDAGPPPGGPGQATVGITPGAGIGASTFDADSFQIDNTGGNNITQIVINLSKAFYPDLRFDPTGQAGDDLAMCVTPGTSDSVGYVVPANPCTTPYSGGTAANGFTTLTLNFTNFGPGEGFSFSADVDPTSIKGFTSAGNAGAVSGLELAGSTATVTFTDGTQSTQTFGDGSQGGSLATVPSTVTAAVGLSVLGVTATDGGYSNSADTATVTGTAQTAVITGPAGSTVKLIVSDAVIEDAPPGGFNDLDPIERNKAVSVTTLTAVIGAGGSVNVPFAVSDTAGEATYIMAAATGAAGLNGPVTAPIYLELDAGPPPGGGDWSHVGTGALVAGTGQSIIVPLPQGVEAGDLLMLGCQGRNNSMNWASTGYTTIIGPSGVAGLRAEVLYKWATGAEPSAIMVTNSSGTNGWSCSLTALRGGVGSGSPLDAAAASQTGNSATMTSPSVTTATDGALVTRWYASMDDNNHGTPSAGTLAFGGTGYHTVTGVDHASSMAFLIDTGAGPTGTATMKQNANAADGFIGFTIALKPGAVVPPGPGAGTVAITPGSDIGATTFGGGPFQIDNTGGSAITQVVIDLSKSFLPDARFDPAGTAGDASAMCLEPDASSDDVGFTTPADPCVTPFSGGTATTGYTTLTLNFTGFAPGEEFNFAVDVDPTTIKGFNSAGNAGAVSGLELAGSTATITFADGTKTSQTFGDGSQGGSDAAVPSAVTQAVGLAVSGVTTADGGFSNGADVANVDDTAQTAVLSAPASTTVTLIVIDAVLEDMPSGGYIDLDDFERNKAVTVSYIAAVVGAGGTANIPFSVSDTPGEATYLLAAATGAGGMTGPVGSPIYLELEAAAAPEVLFRVNAGGPQIAAIDGGPAWAADTEATPSSLHNAGSSVAGFAGGTVDSTVPSTTPSSVFDTERWDAPEGDEMQWNFPVTSGTQVEVRLYLKNGYDGTDEAGERIFDVVLEGSTVLDNLDLSGSVGHQVATMRAFSVLSDGNIDLDFGHVTENPLINAIEIVIDEPEPNVLGVSPTSVNFGSVETGTTESMSVTLTNLGGSGDQGIVIEGVSAGSGEFTAEMPVDPTLDPGQSTTMNVSLTPTSVGPKSGTLSINHTGSNDPVTVALSGQAFAPGSAPVGFSFSQLGGETSGAPTTLQFGPDDRLYVGQQDGTIKVYGVVRTAENDYDVTTTETILDVKLIPNHNDDGTLNAGETNRQLTGLLVTGTAANPVIYATSSDPRIGAGGGPDVNLDTNSGVLSRLTWNGTAWVHVQLVRGLPRSEENHSSNGLALSSDGNTIYIAQGGHTNQGATSNNFAFLPEYALSAAILSVNLSAIGSTPYNLPTIGTSPNQPFGGNDGLNQAKLVSGGPVQVHSPGYRNPYDVVVTAAGRMYTVDNGPNGGWGAVPVGEGTATCTNAVAEPGSTHSDNLHFITGAGYYGGHPNPTRGNKSNTFGGVTPVEPAANSVECDYRTPGSEDGALDVFSSSTNGLTEYTATNFGGQMVGNLLTASFGGQIWRIQLTADGSAMSVPKQALFSGFGSTPLDVTAQGDDDIFPGTVWSATYGAGSITVFEPDDFSTPPGTCTGADNPTLDEDGDLFNNADEIDNGTNPCSAASQPPDVDGDHISDLNDPDDDNDTILDTTDTFAIDNLNGSTTTLPVNLTWNNDAPDEGGLLGLGFTGLMTNGTSDYLTLFDPAKMTAGGAAGVVTVDEVSEGDAVAGTNTQLYAFQKGINVGSLTQPFTASTRILAPFAGLTPQNFQSMGLFIGTGDQSNYVKLVTSANAGAGGIEFAKEVTDVFTNRPQPSVPMPGPAYVDLFLTIDPVANTVSPAYQVTTGSTTGALTALGGPEPIPSTWLDSVLAVGIISTSFGDGDPFAATWDFLKVEQDAAPAGAVAYRVNVGGPTVTAATGPDWTADDAANPSLFLQTGGENFFTSTDGGGTGTVITGPPGVPTVLFDDERWDPNTDDELQYSFPLAAGAVVDIKVYVAEIYSGITAGGERVFDIEVDGSVPSAFNDVDPFALGGGASKGAVVTATGITSDGSIDLEFLHGVENPNPKAIEIIVTTSAPAGLVASPTSLAFGNVETGTTSVAQAVTLTNPVGTDGPVNITGLATTGAGFAIDGGPTTPHSLDPGETTTVGVEFAPTTAGAVTGSLDITHDGAGSPLSVSLSGTGQDPAPGNTPPACLDDAAIVETGGTLNDTVACTDPDAGETLAYSVVSDVTNGTLTLNPNGTFTYEPDPGFAGTDSFTYKAHDGDADSNPATFTINVEWAAGTILYRVNAGGPAVAAVDSGPAWAEDSLGSPSALHNAGSNDGDWGAPPSVHGSVPATTPSSIFQHERWDPGAAGDPLANEMQWDFPVLSGTEVELRVYVRDGYNGTTVVADRVFDISVDGILVEDNFDIIAKFGDNTGAMLSFDVTSDGNIDLDFGHVTENPTINGIEIVVAGAPEVADVVYRVNAGGPSIVFPAGPGWMGDLDGERSPYAVAGGGNSAGTGDMVTFHSSVPAGTPMSLFQSERWDPDTAPEMTWSFPVESGATYEVRLYVAETFLSAADARIYDVLIEGGVAFENVDLVAMFGHDVGGVLSDDVTMTDTSLDIQWLHETENTQINGIEIIKLP